MSLRTKTCAKGRGSLRIATPIDPLGNAGRDLLSGGRLVNESTEVDDTITNLADLRELQAKYKVATNAEIDAWIAGTDDFFDGLTLGVIDDDGEEDILTGSSAED